MDEYAFFREKSDQFIPKTPVAALRAYEHNFVPISVFINKSNSTKPLDEEPYDIEEIERLLSRKNLELQTNIILIEIFEKLIFSDDQEIALFAAESINIIENRYNKEIQLLKEQVGDDIEEGKEEDLEKLSKLGNLFYELAILNRQRDSIKKFFMKESYFYYSKIRKLRKLTDSELNIVIRILLELKLYYNAIEVLEKSHKEKNAFYLLLLAEIEFAKKEYIKVKGICVELIEHIDELTEKDFVMISYWMGA
ncbi:MAG: hypothetical protein PF518_19720 [Spirochaetaceae bacterium]|jgi:hypothetical protein|nr:hypothetical protein [Spirochaetaceae bacterium]